MLTPAEYDLINWEKPGVLYRGTFHNPFETRTLKSVCSSRSPTYFGAYFRGVESTCCTPWLVEAICYANQRNLDVFSQTGGGWEGYPFTRHPLILAINVTPYKKNLRHCEAEGFEITVPIHLEHLAVVYSAFENNLDKHLNPLIAESKNLKQEITYLNNRANPKHNLFAASPSKEARNKLLLLGFGPKMSSYTQEEHKKIQEWLEIMSAFFKPENAAPKPL